MERWRKWRESWGYPTTLLCVYGFLSTVKPLEPFLIPYMTGPDKNLTTEQVNNEIFPVWTYSYLAVLVPVFLLTDWLRYKPVVVFQSICFFVTMAMLLWLQDVPAMQAMQFFYGMVTACEVAYFSYIYSVVDLDKYQKATSYCRSVQLLGYTAGSVLGQVLVSFDLMSYNNILVFTLVLTAVALLTACLLPMPKHSMFFHHAHHKQKTLNTDNNNEPQTPKDTSFQKESLGANVSSKSCSGNVTKQGQDALNQGGGRGGIGDEQRVEQDEGGDRGLRKGGDGGEQPQDDTPVAPVQASSCGQVFLFLWRDFLQCYSSRELLYWSVWWALATCGYNQIINYVQVLWEHIQPSQNFTMYNGGVEAVSALFGAATSYGTGFIQVNWAWWGELALGGFSGLGAVCLFLMTFTGNIWVCYCGYIVYKCLYMLLITIAMFQIAADLSMERYALVFGANTFGALVLQTVITAIFVDSRGLALSIIPQFTMYACYLSLIAVLFSLRGAFTIWRARKTQRASNSAERKKSSSPDPDIYFEEKF